jgi:hypothetical protein
MYELISISGVNLSAGLMTNCQLGSEQSSLVKITCTHVPYMYVSLSIDICRYFYLGKKLVN